MRIVEYNYVSKYLKLVMSCYIITISAIPDLLIILFIFEMYW